MTIRATAEVTAVADPEMRFTPSGKSVASVRVVSNKRIKDSNGQWKDGEPSYFTVEAWERLSEQIIENVSKGTRLLITGRLTCEQYEDRDGNKRVSVKMAADTVALDVKFTVYEKTEKAKATTGSGEPPWTDTPSGQPATESPF